MSDGLDPQLRFTEQRVADLSRRVDIDPQHQTRLREELLRRHQELIAERTQRPAGRLWPPMWRLKGLTLVAPPALAVAVALLLLVSSLLPGSHVRTGTAEAAPIVDALARTAPSVTGWQVTVRQMRTDATASTRCTFPLQPGERLYVRPMGHGGRVYLYASGRWYQVTPGGTAGQCMGDWQWMFAVLDTLDGRNLVTAPGRPIGGRPVEILSYTVVEPKSQRTVRTTLWVERNTGLVRHLERVTVHGKQVLERDVADYRYAYAGTSER